MNSLSFRTAVRAEVPALVRLLADDDLGASREASVDPLPDSYDAAFTAIVDDSNNELVVAVRDGDVVGFLQLTFVPSLTYQGRWRALIESVRVCSEERGSGAGTALVSHAIEKARRRHCHVVQLTTDMRRPDALRFYKRLGFEPTHVGLKLRLDSQDNS